MTKQALWLESMSMWMSIMAVCNCNLLFNVSECRQLMQQIIIKQTMVQHTLAQSKPKQKG